MSKATHQQCLCFLGFVPLNYHSPHKTSGLELLKVNDGRAGSNVSERQRPEDAPCQTSHCLLKPISLNTDPVQAIFLIPLTERKVCLQIHPTLLSFENSNVFALI